MLMSELQTTGVVMDFGHEATYIVPILNGQVSYRLAKTYPVGGALVDAYL